MMSGMMSATSEERNALRMSIRLGALAALGRFSRRAMAAMMHMQTRQMSSPGRMPAANRPPMETPMIEP